MFAAALPLALLAAGILSGCGYFRPARPELPSGDRLIPRYTAPETTLVTLGLAIQDKSASNGQVAYIGGFADTSVDGRGFHAFFDPVTAQRFPGRSTEWDVNREQIYYTNLSRLLPGYAFVFSWGDFRGAPEDDPQATSATLYRSYLVLATRDEGLTFANVARGNAELRFLLIRGNWKLVHWQDWEDPEADFNRGELSFGQLRLAGP